MSNNNPKFKSVVYPSQNSANQDFNCPHYGVYVPGSNVRKMMLSKEGIDELIKNKRINIRGHNSSIRYAPDGDVVFRSSNLADITAAAEYKIGWHLNKNVRDEVVGKRAYVIPTYNAMKKNKDDSLYPVITFNITDKAQRATLSA